jgi:hypothetical protein
MPRLVVRTIDQEQLGAVPEAHRGLPAPFDRGAAGESDEVCGDGVEDAVARLDGLVAERHGEMCFAGPGRVCDAVLMLWI